MIQVSQLALVNQDFRGLGLLLVERPELDVQHLPCRLRGLQHRQAVRIRGRNRLLAVDVLACLQPGDRGRRVQRVVQAHVHRVQVVPFQELVIVLVEIWDLVGLGHTL